MFSFFKIRLDNIPFLIKLEYNSTKQKFKITSNKHFSTVLTDINPMFHFHNLWKYKNQRFFIFSTGIEIEHCLEMGSGHVAQWLKSWALVEACSRQN